MAAGVYNAAGMADIQYTNGPDERGHSAMVAGADTGEGFPHLDLRLRGDWGRHVRTRLSLLPYNAAGICRDSDLWYQACTVGACPPVLHDDGARAEEGERDFPRLAYAGDGGGLRADNDSAGSDSAGCGEHRLPPIGQLDSAQLADVPDRYRSPLGQAVAKTSEQGLRDGHGLLADQLNENTYEALKVLAKLLRVDIEHEPDHEKLTANRRVALGAVRSQLDTHVRVDQNQLRKQEIDTLPQLMKEIADYRRTQEEYDEKIINGETV